MSHRNHHVHYMDEKNPIESYELHCDFTTVDIPYDCVNVTLSLEESIVLAYVVNHFSIM